MRWMLLVVLAMGGIAGAQQPKVKSVATLHDELKAARASSNKITAASELNRKAAQPRLSVKEKSQLRDIAVSLADSGSSEPVELRIIAGVMLANVGSKADAPTLHRLMDDSESRVRSAAYAAAKKINDDDTPTKLLESFTKYGSPNLSETHPIDTLAAIGTPKARKGLELIYEKGSGSIRERAAKALDDLDKRK